MGTMKKQVLWDDTCFNLKDAEEDKEVIILRTRIKDFLGLLKEVTQTLEKWQSKNKLT